MNDLATKTTPPSPVLDSVHEKPPIWCFRIMNALFDLSLEEGDLVFVNTDVTSFQNPGIYLVDNGACLMLQALGVAPRTPDKRPIRGKVVFTRAREEAGYPSTSDRVFS